MALTDEQLEKLNSIDTSKIDDFDFEKAMEEIFNNKKSTSLFFDILSNELSNSSSADNSDNECEDLYSSLEFCYAQLLGYHEIEIENTFNFPDYEDCRTVCVDGKIYDFDSIDEDDDRDFIKELLYEIDAYCADIPDDLETILKNIEKYFND